MHLKAWDSLGWNKESAVKREGTELKGVGGTAKPLGRAQSTDATNLIMEKTVA